MSRKTNNLRARLRIELQKKPKIDAANRELDQRRNALNCRAALSIMVERDYGQHDLHVVTVAFTPELFFREAIRQPGAMGSAHYCPKAIAGRIAEEASHKIQTAIVTYFTKRLNGLPTKEYP